MPAPFLQSLRLRPDAQLDPARFPGSLPFVADLELQFSSPVTFFVGENGSGKSTLIEAIAELCGLPAGGGGRNEAADRPGALRVAELAPFLRAAFRRKPGDGYFFRAEFLAHFATLLDQRRQDPHFGGDPYKRYGGRSLHERSHGEAFLAVLESWLRPGIIIMDEPESALSPQRQLALLSRLWQLVDRGDVQLVIATHSPVLLTFPDARILSFDDGRIRETRLEDTAHYQVTRGILEHPGRYWKHLKADPEPRDR